MLVRPDGPGRAEVVQIVQDPMSEDPKVRRMQGEEAVLSLTEGRYWEDLVSTVSSGDDVRDLGEQVVGGRRVHVFIAASPGTSGTRYAVDPDTFEMVWQTPAEPVDPDEDPWGTPTTEYLTIESLPRTAANLARFREDG